LQTIVATSYRVVEFVVAGKVMAVFCCAMMSTHF